MTHLNSIVYITTFNNDKIKFKAPYEHTIAIKRLSGSIGTYLPIKKSTISSYHSYKHCSRLTASFPLKNKDGSIQRILPNSGIIAFKNFPVQKLDESLYKEVENFDNSNYSKSTVLEVLGFSKCSYCHLSESYEDFIDDYGGMTPDEWHEQTRIDTEKFLESIKSDLAALNKWHGIE